MNENTLAPICLFTYKRLPELQSTVAALQKNSLATESDLFIFSDGGKDDVSWVKVEEIRNYICTITGFKSIQLIMSPVNNGLANSIILGVTQVIEKYGKVIVIEDDLITKPTFLNFMNDCLFFYEDTENIQSINGYSPFIKSNDSQDIYLHKRTFSWGWATWRKYWNMNIFNKQFIKEIALKETLKEFRNVCGHDVTIMLNRALSGKNDSWYIFWTFDHFIHNRFAVYPKISFIENIGYSEESTHCQGIQTIKSSFSLPTGNQYKLNIDVDLNPTTIRSFNKYFTYRYRLIYRLKLLKDIKYFKPLVKELITKIKIDVK